MSKTVGNVFTCRRNKEYFGEPLYSSTTHLYGIGESELSSLNKTLTEPVEQHWHLVRDTVASVSLCSLLLEVLVDS